MENPYGRPVAVDLIAKALDLWEKQQEEDPEICGGSREMFVYQVLARAQYLTESAKKP